ncbi:MAG TPA: DUF2180 family protein, partial [Methanosarcina sp.]|nr:DUF2180 family protein [Methanosarcina sp.]
LENNRDSEAVGVCIVCGKGLCIEHIKQVEFPMKGGYPLPKVTLKKDLPRMMCRECIDATLGEGFCV